jgi:hypothetical protein
MPFGIPPEIAFSFAGIPTLPRSSSSWVSQLWPKHGVTGEVDYRAANAPSSMALVRYPTYHSLTVRAANARVARFPAKRRCGWIWAKRLRGIFGRLSRG